MINVQPFIDKLELLKEYVELSISDQISMRIIAICYEGDSVSRDAERKPTFAEWVEYKYIAEVANDFI